MEPFNAIPRSSAPSSALNFAPPFRPSSVFTRKKAPRPLSNIPESHHSSSEEAEGPVTTGCHPPLERGFTASAGDDKSSKSAWRFNQDSTNNLSASNLPASSVPIRKSSRRRLIRRSSQTTPASPDDAPTYAKASDVDVAIPIRGRSCSPVRSVAERLGHVSSEKLRKRPRTFIRSVIPTNVLDAPNIPHARVSLHTQSSAPLFVGGSTVEGEVSITFDGGKSTFHLSKLSPISIGRLSVDILGVEICQGKKHIFRCLATELIDEDYPPPITMRVALRGISEAFWTVAPSTSVIPFRLDLPIDMGPPPYTSKGASIKYILCTTLTMMINEKHQYVRRSQEIAVLTIHDPEKALVNLPFPLTACDQLEFPKLGRHKTVKLTAGVHRQTWVSGALMFVDVHILNSSLKAVKKIELRLEKVTCYYAHAAAGTRDGPAEHLRLPNRTEREGLIRVSVKMERHGWEGIPPDSQDVRTMNMSIPPGLVTIDTGRFFGVRFFLSVIAHLTSCKPLAVQIPLTIIHPNSLDIPPNSLLQVAKAIELRRSSSHRRIHHPSHSSKAAKAFDGGNDSTSLQVSGPRAEELLSPTVAKPPYSYTQGSAFTAARRCSIEYLSRHRFPAPRKNEHTFEPAKNVDIAITHPSYAPLQANAKFPVTGINAASQATSLNDNLDSAIVEDLKEFLDNSPRKHAQGRTRIPKNAPSQKPDGNTENVGSRPPGKEIQEPTRLSRNFLSFNDLRALRRAGVWPKPRGPRLMRSTSGLGFSSSSSPSLSMSDPSLEAIAAIDDARHYSKNDGNIYPSPTKEQRGSLRIREQRPIVRDLRFARRRGLGLAMGGEGRRNVALEEVRRGERGNGLEEVTM